MKGKLMAQQLQDFNEEKLNCCMQINNLITNKYREFNVDQMLHNEPWDLTPGKFKPTQSSTPIDPKALKKVPKKRGRKSKLSKENVEKSSAISVQESVASSTCDLMMLADIAVTTLHEEEARIGKFGKLPVTKHSKKHRGRKKESKDQADETTDSDIGPGEADDNEPLYCVCNRPSFGNMVECSNDACSIEWFHFSCISMRKAPKGKWYCLKCRSNRNIRKIKKELVA